MKPMPELVDEATMLLQYAMRQRIQVPKTLSDLILAAPNDLAALERSPERENFYAAYEQLAALLPRRPVEIVSEERRNVRLSVLMADAQTLLSYASANGKQVDDDVRKALVETADELGQNALGPAGEERFYKAYQDLTRTLAPVNVATLRASETRVPRLHELVNGREGFLKTLSGFTAGRFLHFVLFVLVLIGSGIALGHYLIGSTALEGYRKNKEELRKARSIQHDKDYALKGAEERLNTLTSSGKPAVEEKSKADNEVRTYRKEKAEIDGAVAQLEIDEKALQQAIRTWMARPCNSFWTRWMCAWNKADFAHQQTQTARDATYVSNELFMASLARDRMAQIILPMLLGLLGAYSYVLRNLSLDIQNRSFAPGSAIHHVVRLSLGALAGIASGWLLRTDEVTAFSSLPSWALAFVAGYSVELVFSAMDRIVGAFTTKAG
jgi:hypothetical protein